jgi:hypothetical protein
MAAANAEREVAGFRRDGCGNGWFRADFAGLSGCFPVS